LINDFALSPNEAKADFDSFKLLFSFELFPDKLTTKSFATLVALHVFYGLQIDFIFTRLIAWHVTR
jgi:hypothetical protein